LQHAAVVFTKVPEAGQVKTRLTIDRGGIFTAEEAKMFYEASLLDVIDHCIASNCCDVYICYNQGGDADYLKQLVLTLSTPQTIKGIFPDEGGPFDHAMQYAADYILRNGEAGRLADAVFIVGGDMPCLQPAHLQQAVQKLEILAATEKALECAKLCKDRRSDIGSAIIESADQAGGFNIIGYTCATPFRFEGVFYNQEGMTALDAVARKALEGNIPISLIEMVPDIDLPEDLGGLIPVMNTLQLAKRYDDTVILPMRTIRILQKMGLESVAFPKDTIDAGQ
jgi:glycosyltransferase A (GT-A) superfamily protein (DUF2064 family)